MLLPTRISPWKSMKPAIIHRILADSATGKTLLAAEIYPSSLKIVLSRCLMLNPKYVKGHIKVHTRD